MLDELLEKLFACETPTEKEVEFITNTAIEVLSKEDNIINVLGPVTICGDIHGQFHDLIELFKIAGLPPYTKFLFMGDYVDRGMHSVEVFSLLLCLKIKYPDQIFLLRGNHESRQITQVYGFYDECINKFSTVDVWNNFTDAFDCLPLSAVVNSDTFCCHGGLGPSFDTFDQINKIDRKNEVPHEGLACDLLWSDPYESKGYGRNPRGAGFLFGKDITEEFKRKNKVKMICRAHQMVEDGYSYNHDKACVTIFTAPNYCYRCGNLAAFMNMNGTSNYQLTQFEPSPENEPELMKSFSDYFTF